MLCDVSGADFTPPGAVAAVNLRITLVLPIPGVFRLGMGFAVAVAGELGAAGVGAWGGWFDWHRTATFPLDVVKPQGSQPVAGLALGLFLLFNHLQYCRPKQVNASAVLDTFWRDRAKPSQTAIQSGHKTSQRARLLLVGGRALDVEVVADLLDRIILCSFAEEERLQHQSVILGEDLPCG